MNFLHCRRKCLAARNQLVRKILEQEGVGYRKGANVGVFIWVDLRPYLATSATAPLEDRWAILNAPQVCPQPQQGLIKRDISLRMYGNS